MKSLVLCPYLPFPPNHGGRIRSVVLCDALRQLGEVTVAAPIPDGELARAEALAVAAGCRLHPLPPSSAGTSMRAKIGHWLRGRSEMLERRWSSVALQHVAALCARGGFDLVAADSSFVLPLVPASLRDPLIVQLHNVESAVMRRSAEHALRPRDRFLRRIEARAIGRVEARALRRAALVVAVSQVDAELARRLASRARIQVVENSIPLERLPLLGASIDPAPLLLFVGSFAYPPNREAARELVTAHLPVLRSRWPALRVRLIGSDPDLALADLSARPGVELLGFVDDLIPHYRAASAIYAPIREGGGTRIKVIESFALGRPVISTAVGMEGLAVEPGRHWLSCETPEDGADSVARVLTRGAQDLIAAGRALVEERHDHRVVIAQLAEIIRVRLRVD